MICFSSEVVGDTTTLATRAGRCNMHHRLADWQQHLAEVDFPNSDRRVAYFLAAVVAQVGTSENEPAEFSRSTHTRIN